ncbi:MAG TPA: hypothetical protein VHW23_01065, partial [Kofleriaceae bacterium]|nr:hypothetical protein [Kofleriaceae bacterium]
MSDRTIEGVAEPPAGEKISPLSIDAEPRDATRGGVNVAAAPRQRGRESPLSIDAEPRDATRGGVNVAAA